MNLEEQIKALPKKHPIEKGVSARMWLGGYQTAIDDVLGLLADFVCIPRKQLEEMAKSYIRNQKAEVLFEKLLEESKKKE